MLVAIYVNYIVIAYNGTIMSSSFKDNLTSRKKCKDLKKLLKLLIMGILRIADGRPFWNKVSYVRDLL